MPIQSDAANLSASAPRRGKYYHETVVFEIEGAVHRVLKHGLEECSSVFRDMFSLPQGVSHDGAKEGEADENPIKLVGCTKDEFESLIEVMYPLLRRTPELPKERWVGVLKLARLWDMPEVAELAIEKLTGFNLKPVEQIKLGKAHGVPTWLKEGYVALVDDPSLTSLSEMTSLGWETSFRILWARDEMTRSEMTVPRPNAYIINSEDMSCGYCRYYNGDTAPTLFGPSASCPDCEKSPDESGFGICIASSSSFVPITIRKPGGSQSKFVADKVAEVFKDELEDAERTHAPALA